jgi:hypothetical protein
VTHLLLGTYNNERQYYDKLFPDVMNRARHLVTYRMWRSWWLLYDVREDLPPADSSVVEAETMERSEGMPFFDPLAGGRFAVRVESPAWETIGRDRISLQRVGRVEGRVFIKPDSNGPLDMSLFIRMSLRGRTVLKRRLAVPREGRPGDYVALPFEAWIGAPGSYLLEIRAAGTGSICFDRIEIRPKT